MSVVDATAAFECARNGHEPLLEMRPNIWVTSFICECKRCHRMVEFESPPIVSV